MTVRALIMVMILGTSVYAEWAGPVAWSAKEGLTDWQRCRYPGVDLIGLGKLMPNELSKTNEQGVMATFQFTDMMRGEAGEYVITIPDDMRNPMDMTVDVGDWKWKEGETYGILCISDEYEAVRMVDWVMPLSKWEAFKASAEEERAEFEAFVRGKKQERLEVDRQRDEVMARKDIGEEEKVARSELLSERRHEIFLQVQEKGAPYFISGIDWFHMDQTWPIEVDERDQKKKLLGM